MYHAIAPLCQSTPARNVSRRRFDRDRVAGLHTSPLQHFLRLPATSRIYDHLGDNSLEDDLREALLDPEALLMAFSAAACCRLRIVLQSPGTATQNVALE